MSALDARRDPTLEARLARGLPGSSIYAYQRVASTMDIAHELAARGEPEGALVWALRQEHSRGRLGRVWMSPAGGAYCSLILRPVRASDETPQIALVAGLCVAETLRDMACVYPTIRWPNDLLLGEKKVSGILVEVKHGAAIIGVGINIAADPSALPPEATSLAASGMTPCAIEDVIVGFCRRMSQWYARWTREGFAPIREALRPWMGLFGKVVHIRAGSQEFEGTAMDLDERGCLLVRLDSGLLRAFEMGEVTLLR